jgi:hypothetical protein
MSVPVGRTNVGGKYDELERSSAVQFALYAGQFRILAENPWQAEQALNRLYADQEHEQSVALLAGLL